MADQKYVIQGFGNVGAWAADILTDMGGKVRVLLIVQGQQGTIIYCVDHRGMSTAPAPDNP